MSVRAVDWHLPCIYYVRNPADGLVKIGTSKNVAKRLKGIEREIGCKLECLGFESGDHAYESQVHRQFASDRREGEWFTFSGELKEHIAIATYPTMRALADNLASSDFQAVFDRLESEKAKADRRIAEYRRRGAKDSPQGRTHKVATRRKAAIGTMAYSVAWRNRWTDELRIAAEAGSVEAWRRFQIWFAAGLVHSMEGRCAVEERDLPACGRHSWLSRALERWAARTCHWCGHVGLHPRLWDLTVASVCGAFPYVQDHFAKLKGSSSAAPHTIIRALRLSPSFGANVLPWIERAEARHLKGVPIERRLSTIEPPVLGGYGKHVERLVFIEAIMNSPDKIALLFSPSPDGGKPRLSTLSIDSANQDAMAELIADRLSHFACMEALHFAKIARGRFGDEFIEGLPGIAINEDGEIWLTSD